MERSAATASPRPSLPLLLGASVASSAALVLFGGGWLLGGRAIVGTSGSPPNLARSTTSYDWCDCGQGLASLDVWPEDDESQRVTVQAASVRWLEWKTPVSKVHWVCNGMSDVQRTLMDQATKVWSVQLYGEEKYGSIFSKCKKQTGRVRWNSWDSTSYKTSVPYTSDSEGYACFKIPSLLRTDRGSLLAFAEARTPNCSDFARTDLVVKRSTDGGLSWSNASRVAPPEAHAPTVCGGPAVVGNAAPVQLARGSHHAGRILVPHTRNNFAIWSVHSDDDGLSWSSPRELQNVVRTDPKGPDCQRNMSYFGFDIDKLDIHNIPAIVKFVYELGWAREDPYRSDRWASKLKGPWQFVGLGPPGSVQLATGPFKNRIVVPAYHSYMRGLDGGNGSPGQLPISQLYNNFALGHVMLSDDGGDTWRLGWTSEGANSGFGEGADEGQIAQLANGSLLLNARSLATGSPQYRVQARSDDGGASFTESRFVSELPEPFNGCQGSIVSDPKGKVFFAHPDPKIDSALLPELARLLRAGGVNLTGRDHMTLWTSVDAGATYSHKTLVDSGVTGYSSLQHYAVGGVDTLGLLYEQADPCPNQDLNSILSRLRLRWGGMRHLTVRPGRH